MSFSPTHETIVDIRVAEILSMLRYKRPMGSASEKAFIERFIEPLGPEMMAGNLVVRIPHLSGEHSRTLFSCHTDTVHRSEGMQQVCYDAELGFIYKDDKEPLGADDGAGCYILLWMIKNGIPGTYVFHEGEECGGIGSSAMQDLHPDFLKQFDRAIAFDRRGSTDVITHQAFDECCSEEFAGALAEQLNAADSSFAYVPDSTGVFTDTANYTHLIPECTNLSVGYEGEHTGGEMLDLQHLLALADAACLVDWDLLPTKRDPNDALMRFGHDDWKDMGLGLRRGKRKGYLVPYKPIDPRVSVLYEPGNDDDDDDIYKWSKYELAQERASEFFGLCVDKRYDRAYQALRQHEVVDFVLEDPKSFEYLLEMMDGSVVDDDEVIHWVRGH